MALSSLSVVSDANRLRRCRARPLAEDAERPAVEPGVEIGAAAPEQAVEPVCGMQVDPASMATTVSANGTAYYFCSTWCPNHFLAGEQRPASERPASADCSLITRSTAM